MPIVIEVDQRTIRVRPPENSPFSEILIMQERSYAKDPPPEWFA